MPATIRHPSQGWFDLEKSVKKTIALIEEAGEKGCKLIAFPETWIPGYPYWQWRVNYQDSLPLLKEYHQNSIRPDSDEMRRIRAAAKTAQIYVSLGYSELAGFGGHYMRPDLIRLLIDKTPKTYIVDANAPESKNFPSTLERLGLGKPLSLSE
ncbi:hypothetical protein QQZ08_011682 [Neonectria magnoliae]|uniref:CN hydrolase domain-containing protein n=1 Tax=Neonectria magnoliae TaxID=2732573 RepID=A0ABR1H8W2_9HYPO